MELLALVLLVPMAPVYILSVVCSAGILAFGIPFVVLRAVFIVLRGFAKALFNRSVWPTLVHWRAVLRHWAETGDLYSSPSHDEIQALLLAHPSPHLSRPQSGTHILQTPPTASSHGHAKHAHEHSVLASAHRVDPLTPKFTFEPASRTSPLLANAVPISVTDADADKGRAFVDVLLRAASSIADAESSTRSPHASPGRNSRHRPTRFTVSPSASSINSRDEGDTYDDDELTQSTASTISAFNFSMSPAKAPLAPAASASVRGGPNSTFARRTESPASNADATDAAKLLFMLGAAESASAAASLRNGDGAASSRGRANHRLSDKSDPLLSSEDPSASSPSRSSRSSSPRAPSTTGSDTSVRSGSVLGTLLLALNQAENKSTAPSRI